MTLKSHDVLLGSGAIEAEVVGYISPRRRAAASYSRFHILDNLTLAGGEPCQRRALG